MREAVYKTNRKRSRKKHKIEICPRFVNWVLRQFKDHKWSFDDRVGRARLQGLFTRDEMVCTHTLYNEVWAGNLSLSVTKLPDAMKRKRRKTFNPRENKKVYGKSIAEWSPIVMLGT